MTQTGDRQLLREVLPLCNEATQHPALAKLSPSCGLVMVKPVQFSAHCDQI